MPRTRFPVDLAVVVGATVLAVTAALANAPIPLNAAAGIPLILFLSGYAILTVTHPGVGVDQPDRKRVRSLGTLDRVLLAFTLSVIVALLVGVVLNFLPIGLTAASANLTLGGVTLLAAFLGLVVRLVDTPPDRRPSFGWTTRPFPWHEGLSLLALGIGLVVLAVAAARFSQSLADEEYVSLFLEPNRLAECYPLRYDGANYSYEDADGRCAGTDPSAIQVVLNNHRDEAMDYTLRVLWSQAPGPEDAGGELVRESTGTLPPLASSDRLVRQHAEPLLTGPPPFEGLQYLKVQLFLGDDGTPEHALQLRVVRTA